MSPAADPDDGKRAERDYPRRVDDAGRAWIARKPFGGGARDVGRHLIDAGYAIQLLDLGEGDRFLEVGCGSGWMTVFAARQGAVATGVDISLGMLEFGRERAGLEGLAIDFVEADAEEALPLAGLFDKCLMYEALHHSHHPDRVLASIRAVLRPGALLLLAEPNWKHRWQGRETTRTYGTSEMGYSTRHLRHLVAAAGFGDMDRFHNNRKRLYGNRPGDVLAHLAEPVVYRMLAPFWTTTWLRAVAV
jgi:SAM-dependent methyltransferase